jgi:hypothetical protein
MSVLRLGLETTLTGLLASRARIMIHGHPRSANYLPAPHGLPTQRRLS